MDPSVVNAQLVAVLQSIQTLSGEACPPLNSHTRPAEELPKFTSKIWPVAAGLLGAALGKTIPCEANIFVDETTKQPLAIHQTVALVCKIVEENEKKEEAA